MKKFYNKLLNRLDVSINQLKTDDRCHLRRNEIIIQQILNCLLELKAYVLSYKFKNIDEEIHFFKHQKPKIIAKLIYYNTIYKVESKWSLRENRSANDYINHEISEIKRFFDNNIAFYTYYRTQSTYLDHIYFVRGKQEIKLGLDNFIFEADPKFSTSHDYKVANIIASELVQKYLEKQLNDKPSIIDQSISWTGSKTALVELIYALHAYGVFNNGNVELKNIARTFQNTFSIDLGDFYHTFLEVKSRKINRTKLLDALKDTLIKKMDDMDSHIL